MDYRLSLTEIIRKKEFGIFLIRSVREKKAPPAIDDAFTNLGSAITYSMRIFGTSVPS